MTSAGICRANGWGPGTVLEGGGVTRIQIVEIDDAFVRARLLANRHKGSWRKPALDSVNIWNLTKAPWKEIPQREGVGS